ncbi:CLUMA_CG005727, isoform A [Clunio marinus]|uniref:CLUMA_CG005727, isoform A n=1 Tax=Clunio marinus TaxID=568069 RepID=A0A1J1I0C6_9DIPT|nr:CLUMA_CG005727, isoform A [Clunio marinus]
MKFFEQEIFFVFIYLFMLCECHDKQFRWNHSKLLKAESLNYHKSSVSSHDEHATNVKKIVKRDSFLPPQNPSNRNYFRDLISRNEDINEGTVEYTIDPFFSGYHTQKQRKQQSEIHGGSHVRITREVHVRQGRLTGIVREMNVQSRLENVDQFLGIPYAEAPIGSRRFMPPSSPLPWSDVKRANKMESVCPQKLPNLNDPSGYNNGRYDQIKRLLPYLKSESEDCLYLNLYVRSLDDKGPTKNLPVIVFVHGESFEWNSGNPYDGSILASYGQVIVITLNYRLGALGFLKPGLNDQTVANFGLLDIIAALQWIKENVEQFGGDRNSVTLLGYDTGAICVNFLMISPVARGLFHRAILMSGSALSDWALNYNPQQITMQVAKQLNCPIEDPMLGECLRKKSYQEILNVTVMAPEFLTIFGPIVDGLVIPSDPHQFMADSDAFGRFDLLFGMTEIESFNILGREAIQNGIPQIDRDHNIRRYLVNRFDKRPEIAILTTLKEYTNTFLKPKPLTPLDHRDMLLEILSDARLTAPLVQTGIYHSRTNPKCYMYVFAHNSESGDYATISQSIHGEELPYLFGAPLGASGPFQTFYNAQERLLSEAVMRYFSYFAKLGKPTCGLCRFTNMNPIDWEKYDVDWQEFSELNQNYLHLGIPPIISQRYRHKYTKFWNEGLPETMKNANSLTQFNIYGKLWNTVPEPRKTILPMPTGQISMYPIKVEIEGATDDPVRELRHRLQQSRNSFQSTSLKASTESINYEQISSDDQVMLKSETTTILLIAVIVAFLFVNLVGLLIYLYRRKKNLDRKYDNSNIFDDDKRSKFNDTDESFILRKSNNTYESMKRHSPINGYGVGRQTSTSTVDTHMRVNDDMTFGWMVNDVAIRSYPHQNTFAIREKVSVAIDATPNARSNSILRQEPIEVTKAKSMDFGQCGRIICQDVDMDMSMIDEIPFREFRERTTESDSSECSSFSHCEECEINHQNSSFSDPSRSPFYQQEEVTSFIEPRDVNVTSRDDPEKIPLSPEESLNAIRRMNYPKVLPNYPENLHFNDSTKRRSLQIPPQFYQIHNTNTLPNDDNKSRPSPPPRMSSTLGRNNSKENPSRSFMTQPQQAVEPPTVPVPEITSSSLTVGPLVPKSENIYMSMQRKKSLSRENSASSHGENEKNPLPEKSSNEKIHNDEHLYAEIIKNSLVQSPQDGIYSISTGKGEKKLQTMNSQESNSSSSSGSSSTGTIKEIN